MSVDTNEFLASYIETAVWSSVDEAGSPLDGLGLDLADETIAAMRKDCTEFEDKAIALLNEYDYCSGDFPIAHDFWLTRNHHGAGFWDGDYPEPLGKLLTDLAHSYKECDLYVGDDNLIHLG